jgi:hypothetical protein
LKQFAVAPHALFGVGIEAFFAKMDDEDSTATLKAQAFNLMLDFVLD